MPCSRFSRLAMMPGLFVLAASFATLTPAVHTSAVASPDTIIVDIPDIPEAPPVSGVTAPPAPPAPTVKKRIVIGGSGVRIEGEGSDSTGALQYDFNFGSTDDHGGDDSIVRVGESVYVAPGEVIPGDVVVFGGNAIIEGTVAGSVVVLGGEIRVRNGAEVKGDIVAIGGKIVEDDDVVIRGEKILVGGIATHVGDALNLEGDKLRAIGSAFMLFVGLIMFLITMLFLRGRVERTSEHLSAGVLRSFGAGVLASIALQFAILIVIIPLVITVIGIPLAIILFLSYIGVFVIACTVFAYAVGRAISARVGLTGGVMVRLLVGFLVLSVPELVAFLFDSVGHGPINFYIFLQIVSAVVWLFGYIVGLGSIVLSRFGTRPPVGVQPPGSPVGDLSVNPVS